MNPMDLQRTLQDPYNELKDIGVRYIESDESIASALGHARRVSLSGTSIHEVLLAVYRRTRCTSITIDVSGADSNVTGALKMFFLADLRLRDVTLSVDSTVLNGLDLAAAQVTLQRLVVRQTMSLEMYSHAIAEYSRRTSTPVGMHHFTGPSGGDDEALSDLCGVVDDLRLYHDSRGLVELSRCPKLRRLTIMCADPRIPQEAWDSVLSCRHCLDSIFIVDLGVDVDFDDLLKEYTSQLIRENLQLIQFRVRLGYLEDVPFSWIPPTELRNTLHHNRRRRMEEFIVECNLLPRTYCDSNMGMSLLYLLIQANCNALRDE